MKVLNLYAGIGGNRKMWKNAEVTAVEYNEIIVKAYCDFFPSDKVIIANAHEYLLEHYKEFDFIWSSPPCQSHSSFRQNICVRYRGTKPVYPDMRLYQEILFLKYNFDGLWVVENVKPYYEFLIQPTAILQRHAFWANFDIAYREFEKDVIRGKQIPQLQNHHGFDLSKYSIPNKRQVLRNCVYPPLGNHIYLSALGENNALPTD
jgi:DNA (cytosine-5)-methyltransferase 1